jgi:anion-transporting  ArsA/GET3 family ATPase
VLTIDPARRLAAALGNDGIVDDERPVALDGLTPLADARAVRSLDAAMVDTKASFDALIRRIAPDDATRDRILANRAYQAFSRTMARSHAYVAMERLHHAIEDDRYDVVILDTPPMRSALEILDAPGRLVRFLDERVLRWFLRNDVRPVRDSTVLRLLATLAGDSIVEELVRFVFDLAPLRTGFRDRAARVQSLLGGMEAAFVLVTAPESSALADAGVLRAELESRGVTLAASVFNRAFVSEPAAPATPVRPPSTQPSRGDVGAALDGLRARLVARNARLARDLDAFASEGPRRIPSVRVPVSWGPVHRIDALAALLDDSTVV